MGHKEEDQILTINLTGLSGVVSCKNLKYILHNLSTRSLEMISIG